MKTAEEKRGISSETLTCQTVEGARSSNLDLSSLCFWFSLFSLLLFPSQGCSILRFVFVFRLLLLTTQCFQAFVRIFLDSKTVSGFCAITVSKIVKIFSCFF